MPITLADAKASRIAPVLNLDPESSDFLAYLNEAQERLLHKGKFWGTYQRVRMCVTDGCLVLPPQIAAIEAVAVCGQPITIRSQFFEFMESSAGLMDGNCSSNTGANPWCCMGNQLIDRGTVCAYDGINGTNKKLRVYADVAESAGAQALFAGWDENGNWIRTQVGDQWIDGEYIDLSTTPQLSSKFFTSQLASVQKPVTNGPIRVYEYNTDDATQRLLAVYEPGETRPSFRRMFIPGLPSSCCNNDSEDEAATVTVMAKLSFFPARINTDWLIIGNLNALKFMCQAIFKEEANLPTEAAFYEGKAIDELQKELRHHLGSGIVQPLRMQPRNVGGGAVRNLI